MSVLIQDTGFVPDDWAHGFATSVDESGHALSAGLSLTSADDVSALSGQLGQIAMIRVFCESFADGRAFSMARQLRLMGYAGRLRLSGPMLADQYAMARRVGFDEVEIDDAHAARQPETSWRFRTTWQDNDYQARLRGEGRLS